MGIFKQVAQGSMNKIGKTFRLKELLQKYLYLSSSKGINGAQIRGISNLRPVFLWLDQAFEVQLQYLYY